MQTERYLRTEEAGRLIGLSGRTLEKHRSTGTGPKYSKIGGRVVYTVTNLEAWVKGKETRSTKSNNPDRPLQDDKIITEADAAPAQLDTCEAALFLGLSPRTVEKYRRSGAGPKYSKVGRRIVYEISDLREWDQGGANNSASETSETMVPAIPIEMRDAI